MESTLNIESMRSQIVWRKAFLSLGLVYLLCFITNSYGQPQPSVRIGLIADIQYGNIDPAGTRFYRNSLQKLEACVADLNSEKVDFTVNLGDLTDRSPEDLDPVISLLGGLAKPVFNTTGNHDYVGVRDNEVLHKRLGMPAAYYSFDHSGWVFVMLNTNEVASYSNVTGTEKEKELEAMMARIRKAGRSNGQTWNGGISKKQMKWMDGVLKSASRKNKKVLVFSHHPIWPAEGFTALNDQEILQSLAKYKCVKAVISGHHHVGAFATYEGIPCITTEGMVETADQNAYGLLEIYSDRLVLTGKGRTRTHEILLSGK